MIVVGFFFINPCLSSSFLKGILKNKWSILYLLLSLSEDPRKQSNKVGEETFVTSEEQ